MWSCTDAVTQWDLPTATLLPVYSVGRVLAMWKQLMKLGFSSRGSGEPSTKAHLPFQLIIHHWQEAAGLPGNLVFLRVCDSDSARLRDDRQCSPGSWSCRPTPRPPPGAGRRPRASRPPLCAAPSRHCTQSFQDNLQNKHFWHFTQAATVLSRPTSPCPTGPAAPWSLEWKETEAAVKILNRKKFQFYLLNLYLPRQAIKNRSFVSEAAWAKGKG